MTITARQLTNPADDETDGLEAGPVLLGSTVPFYTATWSEGRRSNEEASFFKVARISGDGVVRGVGGGDVLLSGISDGDYIAFDSYVVWHIPQNDWSDLDIVVSGIIATIDVGGGGGQQDV